MRDGAAALLTDEELTEWRSEPGLPSDLPWWCDQYTWDVQPWADSESFFTLDLEACVAGDGLKRLPPPDLPPGAAAWIASSDEEYGSSNGLIGHLWSFDGREAKYRKSLGGAEFN